MFCLKKKKKQQQKQNVVLLDVTQCCLATDRLSQINDSTKDAYLKDASEDINFLNKS